jgi:hypothetical protein
MILSLLLQKKESHLRIFAPGCLGPEVASYEPAPHRGDGRSSIDVNATYFKQKKSKTLTTAVGITASPGASWRNNFNTQQPRETLKIGL